MLEFYINKQTKKHSAWVKFNCLACNTKVDMSWRPQRFNGLCPTCKGGRQPGAECEKFKRLGKEVHKGKYTYDLVEYVNAHTKVLITCPLHGEFLQKPSNHTALANGCPICGDFSKRKHLKDIQHTVYFVYFPEHSLFKVGVTNKKISYRFSGETQHKVVWQLQFAGAYEAYTLEGMLLKKYQEFKYIGEPILRSGGNTELLTIEIPKPELHTLKGMSKSI